MAIIPMSLRGYARRRNVSAEAVSKAVARGRLRRSVQILNGQPKIADPDLADQEWVENTQRRADHREGGGRQMRPVSCQFVYFIQCSAGPIKIGVAVNIAERLKALQTASPFRLHLIACIVGGYELEAKLHDRLAVHRLQGEWFDNSTEVREAIAEMTAPKAPV